MTLGWSLRWTMTSNSFFEGLSCLVICLTLRRISRRMGWNLRPILQRGGPQLRCRAFPLSKRPRRRSMRSARELSSPMHIFQNFLKTLVLDAPGTRLFCCWLTEMIIYSWDTMYSNASCRMVLWSSDQRVLPLHARASSNRPVVWPDICIPLWSSP